MSIQIKYLALLLSFGCLYLLSGCLPAPFFQKEAAIPQYVWHYNFKPSFKFEITDTNTSYQPFFIIRHTQAYPYSNLWMWLYIKVPGDSVIKKERINIILAETSGKWLGRGMGEIYEQRIPMSFGDSVSLRKAGSYEISIEQNMRVNPLPEVMNVGLRIEKSPLRR